MIKVDKTLAQIHLEHKTGKLDMSLYPNNQAICCWSDESKKDFYAPSMKWLVDYLDNWKERLTNH